MPFAGFVFEYVGCKVEWLKPEGHYITKAEAAAKTPVAKVTGPTRCILVAERTALNILSRASGVATASAAAMDIARKHGWHGRVAGTRKTTPGFGIVEKYALLVGGADTHRMDLSNMVMLKDNHIWSTGSIADSVARARFACGFSTKIEVECTSEEDAIEACEAGAEIVMLDNYVGDELKAVAGRIKVISTARSARFPLGLRHVPQHGPLAQPLPAPRLAPRPAARLQSRIPLGLSRATNPPTGPRVHSHDPHARAPLATAGQVAARDDRGERRHHDADDAKLLLGARRHNLAGELRRPATLPRAPAAAHRPPHLRSLRRAHKPIWAAGLTSAHLGSPRITSAHLAAPHVLCRGR